MVWIAREDHEKYPNFGNFVLKTVTKAPDEPEIWKAMLLASHKGMQIIKSDLRAKALKVMGAGSIPRITWKWYLHKDTTFYAEFEHTTNYIYINQYHVERFEKDHENWGAQRFAKAVVLHEMVHCIDYLLDDEFQDYDIVGDKKILKKGVEERGDYFERMAFGQFVGGSW
jgi:hypothetical protein